MPITRDTPALKPPEGQMSNFDDPYTLRPAQVAVCVVAIVLSTSVITARLITRVASKYGLHLEDCESDPFSRCPLANSDSRLRCAGMGTYLDSQ